MITNENNVFNPLAATAKHQLHRIGIPTAHLIAGSTPDFLLWESGSRWGHAYHNGLITEWDGERHVTK